MNKNPLKIKCLYCQSVLSSKYKQYCNNKCKANYDYNNYIQRWKQGLEPGSLADKKVSHPIKRYLFEKYENKCGRCGWTAIHPVTKRIPLQVEHIDGDCENNKEDNLILLCPNCHVMTPTYGALNKGKSKRHRK
jgi:hypothetical protein